MPSADSGRTPYQQASRQLLRSSVFDAMHVLLEKRDWSAVTMADVAKAAGLSRQTLYTAFGNRQGLAQAYALQLADQFAGAIRDAILRHPDDIGRAISEGIDGFLAAASSDPLVRAVVSGDVKPDLLRLLTTEAGPLIDHAADILTPALAEAGPRLDPANARLVAMIIARIGISFISLPPDDPESLAAGLADVLTPYLRQLSA